MPSNLAANIYGTPVIPVVASVEPKVNPQYEVIDYDGADANANPYGSAVYGVSMPASNYGVITGEDSLRGACPYR